MIRFSALQTRWLWLVAMLALVAAAPATAQGTPTALQETPIPPGSGTTACVGTSPSGRLLLQSLSSAGVAQPGLRVVNPATGIELAQINVPPVDVVFPTALPNRALAIAGGALYLVDTTELSARAIPLGEPATDLAPNPIQFRGTAGTRFVLLGSPSLDKAFLIDVESAKSTNLTKLIPAAPGAPVAVPFAAVTPDDAHVLLWDGQHVYVVATESPAEARRLDSGAFAFAPDFSPDGRELIYSSSSGPGSGSSLVLESIDGSASRVLKTSQRAMVTLWVPQSRSILIDERTETGAAAGSAYLFDLESGSETPLLEYSGSLTTVQFSPDGTRALLGAETMGGGSWHIADLTNGTVEPLESLGGSRVLPGLYADSRWALAVPFGEDTDPLSRPAYRGIDLETGAVGRLLQQEAGLLYPQQPTLSKDGRFSLVTGQSDFNASLWLLDAAELRATKLAEGSSVTALFSPDACHVTITVGSSVDGLPGSAVTLVPSTGGAASEIGDGRALAWLAN